MHKQSFNESIAFITIFGFAVFSFIRAFFWTIEQNRVVSDSEFYMKLHEIMPIWIWGILLMVGSVSLMVSAFFLPRHPYNKLCGIFLCCGGFICAIMYFLMTSASIFNAINWLTWVQFAVLTVICGALGFVGGANLYERRK